MEDVYAMQQSGVLADGEHVELLSGDLLVMTPQGPAHRALRDELRIRLSKVIGEGWHVSDQSPLQLDDFTCPEPDLAVIRGQPRNYLEHHPSSGDVSLVIELAWTSHARDRAKAEYYARLQVPEYWLLDIPGRTLEVRTGPGDRYEQVSVLGEDDEVQVPGIEVIWAVRSMFV